MLIFIKSVKLGMSTTVSAAGIFCSIQLSTPVHVPSLQQHTAEQLLERWCETSRPWNRRCWCDEEGLCVFQILHWSICIRPLLLCNLVPDLSVDPQGSGEGEAGSGAGNPAAQRAGDGVNDALQLGHFFQARGAEGVVAVENPRDPVAAWIFIAAHNTLQLLIWEHGDFSTEWKSPGFIRSLIAGSRLLC